MTGTPGSPTAPKVARAGVEPACHPFGLRVTVALPRRWRLRESNPAAFLGASEVTPLAVPAPRSDRLPSEPRGQEEQTAGVEPAPSARQAGVLPTELRPPDRLLRFCCCDCQGWSRTSTFRTNAAMPCHWATRQRRQVGRDSNPRLRFWRPTFLPLNYRPIKQKTRGSVYNPRALRSIQRYADYEGGHLPVAVSCQLAILRSNLTTHGIPDR